MPSPAQRLRVAIVGCGSAGPALAAFLAFLEFLKGNLGGQTALRVDTTWASQATLLQAVSDFALPDRVIRETHLAKGLRDMAQEIGITAPDIAHDFTAQAPFPLAEVRTDAVDTAIRAAYQRDFMMFGFDRWTPA